MSLIEGHNLAVGYGGVPVHENLNFTVNSGDYLCIVGENGSGKSTLMKTVLGLLSPMAGELKRGEELKNGHIGYLPQQTAAQKDFPASVWEIVLSGCQGRSGLRPVYSREEKQRARDAMEQMEITSMAGRCYRELSGGQQQRVLLARALCATGTVLLLDEPVSGLDPKVTAEMYALIRRLNQKDGLTVIMISHDLRVALEDATHILHVGNPSFFGTREAYLGSETGKRFLAGEGVLQ